MAEELVNEAFYKAFIASDIPKGSFKFWLFRVLKNQFIDFKRKESRLHPIGQFEAGFSDIRKEGPANKYITKERDERLYLYLVALEPEIYREVIFLFYYGDMSIKDIALTLSLSTGNTKTTLYRACKKLGRLLKEDPYEF